MFRIFKFCLKCAIFVIPVIILVAVTIILNYVNDLPRYDKLEDYYPPSVTRIYSQDGYLIGEYAKEHRIFVELNSIPIYVINAFVATEDKNFYKHIGIDLIGLARAVINNLASIVTKKSITGASTITQQVVKNFLLTPDRSIERKIKEALLAYILSNKFNKNQIMELYLNHIYLGKGMYGLAAASMNYFNKSVDELTLNESAFLAALPKAPSTLNPNKNYDKAFARKNYVLKRMYEEGYISKEIYLTTIKEPIKLEKYKATDRIDARYYVDQVVNEAISMYGEEYFYNAGLTITTCLDTKMQKAAQTALRNNISKYDKFNIDSYILKRNIDLNDKEQILNNYSKIYNIKDTKTGIITSIDKEQANIILQNEEEVNIKLSTLPKIKNKEQLTFQKGDLIIVKLVDNKTTSTKNSQNSYEVVQIPKVNGSIFVMNPHTGQVLAMEGGYNYGLSKFNRATQANRQVGSLIKPFIYLTALESGMPPNTIFIDEPLQIEQGPNMPLWEPRNYENKFFGPTTMRKGLEKSRNIITLLVSLELGIDNIIKTIKRFDIANNLPPFYSITLGAFESTLEKMCKAYGIIANGGYKIEPQYIELIQDRKGNILYKRDERNCDICNLDLKKYDNLLENSNYGKYNVNNTETMTNIALPKILPSQKTSIVQSDYNYQITSFMQGSSMRGTTRKTAILNKIVAGKTGTTNESRDGWFIGFTPNIVVGTYIGFDTPKSLGNNISGASIAIPVFNHFMQNAYKTKSLDFPIPKNIQFHYVDYETGNIVTDPKEIKNNPNIIKEAFSGANYEKILNNNYYNQKELLTD